ncbi:DUF667 domain-containing protein [Nephila pilipes]|uniref:DUF667 domain-containing protein n=1 Tax=Nephila pilipes TaxID=299642 RepID=A0A8X6TFQ5_NEPPI|nr:DUF667 domain-containing protein [Nephila pilipes]
MCILYNSDKCGCDHIEPQCVRKFDVTPLLRPVNLHLPVLVFQIYFPTKPSILIDVGVSCFNSMRKRITLSTTMKNKVKSELSVSFPLAIKQDFTWFHLFIDVEDAVSLTWKREEFKSIDSVSIGGMCYLKRVFALRKDMIQNQEEGIWLISYDRLPKQICLSKNIPQTQICVLCSEDAADEKDDMESLNSIQSGRTICYLSSVSDLEQGKAHTVQVPPTLLPHNSSPPKLQIGTLPFALQQPTEISQQHSLRKFPPQELNN